MLQTLSGKVIKKEWILFKIFTILNLVPLFVVKIFPTLDGPAHLYNATLIRNLATGNDFLQSFFIFNTEPVPNWTGHVFLVALNLFMPAWLAEKLIQIALVVALPLAFRRLVLTISPENRFFSFLAFPFSYSFAFFLGFYNFYIALVLMMSTLAFWLNNSKRRFQARNIIWLFILISCTYFSHIMIYGLLLFFLGLQIFFEAIHDKTVNPFKSIFNNGLKLCLVCLPTLILFSYYFISRPEPDQIGYLEKSELTKRLFSGAPFTIFHDDESYFARLYSWMIVFLAAAGIIYGLLNRGLSLLKYAVLMNVWFWILVIVFGLYYTFPDSLKWTSFISSRLGLLVYIFAVLWICGLNFPRRSGFIIPIAILLITIPLYGKYLQSVRSLSVEANSCYDAQEFIRPNSTVLPLNYPGNWFAAHFSNYLGAEKPVAVLENYECGLDYFPLRWNMDRIPNTLLGETSCYDIPCAYWVFDSSHVAMKIDYVFVLGDQVASADSCHRELRKTILDGYNLVNRTEHYELFERK